jgi:enoyl-CoA hydratase/carnithine racemase
MTGRTVLAEEMHRHGLVNHLYPKEDFIEKTTQFATAFADKEADRLQVIKQITKLSVGDELAAQKAESAALNKFYQSKEGKEKIQEFYRKSLERKK